MPCYPIYYPINPKAESVDDHFAKQEATQEAQAAPEVESTTESSPVSEDNHEEKQTVFKNVLTH